MGRWAIIDETSCGTPEDAETLRPFMKVFEEIGRRWKIQLVVDYKTDETRPRLPGAEAGDTEEAHIHIAASAPGAHVELTPVSSLFGYHFFSGFVNLKPAKGPQLTGKCVISDKGNGYYAAQVEGNHVYILADIIGNPTEDNNDLVRIVTHLAIMRIGQNAPDPAIGYIKKRAERLAKVMRRKFTRSDVQGILGAHIREESTSVYESVSANVRRVREKRIELLNELQYLKINIANLTGFLKSRTVAHSDEEYAEMFEEISRIKGVTKVDALDNKIYVWTERLRQYVENKHGYGIGAFKITIDPKTPSECGIDIYQTIPGRFKHYHAIVNPARLKSPNICFGTNKETGLNESVIKLMATFEIVSLVHLILSFLRLEETEPVINKGRSKNKRGATLGYTLRYPSQEFREEAKKRFIEFMAGTHIDINKKYCSEKLGALNKEREAKENEYGKLLREEREARALAEYTDEIKQNIAATAGLQALKLLRNKRVVFVEIKAGLRAYLYDTNAGLYVMWFAPREIPWVLCNASVKNIEFSAESETARILKPLSKMNYVKCIGRFSNYIEKESTKLQLPVYYYY